MFAADDLVVLALLAAGMVACFRGYAIFKLWLGLQGFLLGALGTWAVTGLFVTDPGTLLVASAVGGLVGGVLAFAVYRLGLFVSGGVVGLGTGVIACGVAGGSTPVLWALAGGAVGGVLALVFDKVVLVAVTALGGALLIVASSLHLLLEGFDLLDPKDAALPRGQQALTVIAAWVVLSVGGMVAQYKAGAGRAEEDDA